MTSPASRDVEQSEPETTNGAVRAVHIVTTGTGEQHAEHRHGSTKPLMWWVLTSKSWIPIPINCYLIEHRDGLVLFDTGLNPAIVSDPDYVKGPNLISTWIGRFLLARIFRFHIGPDDSLTRRLEALGFDPADVRTAVISHLHFDHVGGLAEIPQAELLVNEAEWRRLSEPHPENDWILREHIELPRAKWRPIQFAPMDDPLVEIFGGGYDVAGDGSMVLLPTPGHTPGSMSMLVRSEALPPLLFTGDLTYEIDLLMKDQVPGLGDPKALRDSFAKVRALRDKLPDLVILAAHDPAVFDAIQALGACSGPPRGGAESIAGPAGARRGAGRAAVGRRKSMRR